MATLKYVYLASPYSHNNPAVRELRYELARVTTAWYLERGFAIFSPIVYGKHMEKIVGLDFKSWKNFNDAMLLNSGSMLVLRLDGWEDSAGVTYEISMAKTYGIAINYIDPTETGR